MSETSTPEPAYVDEDGVSWWHFMFSYDWEGASYGFEICARSEDEAKARLKRIPLARFDGIMVGNPIPVTAMTRVTVPLSVWWRNVKLRLAGDA